MFLSVFLIKTSHPRLCAPDSVVLPDGAVVNAEIDGSRIEPIFLFTSDQKAVCCMMDVLYTSSIFFLNTPLIISFIFSAESQFPYGSAEFQLSRRFIGPGLQYMAK
jgi:hypothetical protein